MGYPAKYDPMARRRRRRAVIVGESERPLVELLSDVLADIDITVQVDATSDGDAEPPVAPDMVLVVVGRDDVAGVFGRARALAAGAPVVAILPFHDERLMRRSFAFGASACYSLDSSLEKLKSGFFSRSDRS
jgi:hypothetical protein